MELWTDEKIDRHFGMETQAATDMRNEYEKYVAELHAEIKKLSLELESAKTKIWHMELVTQ